MLNSLSKTRTRRHLAADLYAAIVGRAREPVFYAKLGVADTIDGRFDLLALHAWLVLDRLRQAGLNDLSQDLTNAIFVSFDENLRDMGAGDMGIGRRIKKLADAFYGRLHAYQGAADQQALEAAVARNLYRGENEHAPAVARYVEAARLTLSEQDLSLGRADFGPVPTSDP